MKLEEHNINVVEKEVAIINHDKGHVQSISFADNSSQELDAIYAAPETVQHCAIPEQLGCELGENGLLVVDDMQQTIMGGIYACGDNITPMRSVSIAIAAGMMAGAALNKEMILDAF